MAEHPERKENSQAIQIHLGIIQSVIQRMASNSTSCKAWCIALVSAVLVVVADKGKPEFALIAVIPTLLFFVLDIYYLTLERMFRQSYNSFIDKVHQGKVTASDLYAVMPTGSVFRAGAESVGSFSIWPFYLALLAMIWIVKTTVILDGGLLCVTNL